MNGSSEIGITGDWRGYRQRGPTTSVAAPTGIAPTQELGAALHADPRVEGFPTLSARLPYSLVLGVFPQKLRPASWMTFTYQEPDGNVRTHRIA